MHRVVEPQREQLGDAAAQPAGGVQAFGQVTRVVVAAVRLRPGRQHRMGGLTRAGQRPAAQKRLISHIANPAQAEATSTLTKVPMMNRSAAPVLLALSSG